MPNLTMSQLRAFVAVSRYASFTLAAAALHRTQPAITSQVKQLEQQLGLLLIDRTTRQLRLTEAGLRIVPAMAAMLQQLEAVVESTQDLRALRTGLVRIGCLPSVAATWLPPRIAQFRAAHPGVSFLLQDALGDKVIAMVTSGEVEFGITDIQPATHIDATPLLEDSLCALFLDGHPLQRAKRLDVDVLARHDLILMAHGSNARRIVDSAFAAAGRAALAACEANYMSTAVGMVQAGLGIALLPLSGVPPGIDARLRTRVVDAPGFSRQIALVRLRGKTLSPAAAAFVAQLSPAPGPAKRAAKKIRTSYKSVTNK